MDPMDVSHKNKPVMQQMRRFLLSRMKHASTQIIIAYVVTNLIPTKILNMQQSNNLFGPAIENLDPYDLRQNSSASFPPEYYVNLLQSTSTMNTIGAKSHYQECADSPYELFAKTGDVRLFH